MRHEDSKPKYLVLWEEVIASIESNRPSRFSEYWRGVFDYFAGELNVYRYQEVASGMVSICIPSQATEWCICTGIASTCGDYGFGDCDGGCGTVSPDTDGESAGSAGSNGSYVSYWFPIFGGNGPGGGQNSTGSGSSSGEDGIPTLDWESLIEIFECDGDSGFLEMPDDESEYSGGDWEVEMIESQGSLFEQLLRLIINEYNLDFTTEELKDILKTDCFLSTYNEVSTFVRFKLIEDLSSKIFLTEQDKWALFDSFEYFQAILDAFYSNTSLSLPSTLSNIEIALVLNSYFDISYEISSWIFDANEPGNLAITLELLEFLEEEELDQDFAVFAFEVFLEDFSETTSLEGLIEISLNPNDYRTRMSASELEIFDSMSYLNQLRYLYSAYQAETRASQLYPGIYNLRNGLGDAYRHALWNALGAKRLGESQMDDLATAHEDIPPDYEYRYKEQEMDLFNNEVGRNLSSESGKLWQVVKSSLDAGDLRYLHPRGFTIDGVYFSYLANEQSELIPTNQ